MSGLGVGSWALELRSLGVDMKKLGLALIGLGLTAIGVWAQEKQPEPSPAFEVAS